MAQETMGNERWEQRDGSSRHSTSGESKTFCHGQEMHRGGGSQYTPSPASWQMLSSPHHVLTDHLSAPN